MAGDPIQVAPRSTFAKVCVTVAAGGVIACALLALRQQRLQALHEMAASQLRLQRHEERVFEHRARIAELITPTQVRRLAADLAPIRPLGVPDGPGGMAVAGGASGREPEEGRP